MSLSRSSSGAVPRAASRGRASSGNADAEGSGSLPGAQGKRLRTPAFRQTPQNASRNAPRAPAPLPPCGVLPRPRGVASLEGMRGVSWLSRDREAPDVLASACCLPSPFLPLWAPFLSSLHPSQSSLLLRHPLFRKVFHDTPPGAMLGCGPEPSAGGRGPPCGLAVAAPFLCHQPRAKP